MKLRYAIILLFLFLATAGCNPKPDYSIVFWEQPSPSVTAINHSIEIGGKFYVTKGVSMEPMIYEGDWIVVDPKFPFKDLKSGMLLSYQAAWRKPTDDPVCHMAADTDASGRWIMDGINNPNYERGWMAVSEKEYRGRVVAIYTKRKKP